MRALKELANKIVYDLGDIVYLKTDPDQHKRMIGRVGVDFAGVVYTLCMGDITSIHYAEEISSEKTIF
jgi:hypothetical protein